MPEQKDMANDPANAGSGSNLAVVQMPDLAIDLFSAALLTVLLQFALIDLLREDTLAFLGNLIPIYSDDLSRGLGLGILTVPIMLLPVFYERVKAWHDGLPTVLGATLLPLLWLIAFINLFFYEPMRDWVFETLLEQWFNVMNIRGLDWLLGLSGFFIVIVIVIYGYGHGTAAPAYSGGGILALAFFVAAKESRKQTRAAQDLEKEAAQDLEKDESRDSSSLEPL